jgi:hypothetical protein
MGRAYPEAQMTSVAIVQNHPDKMRVRSTTLIRESGTRPPHPSCCRRSAKQLLKARRSAIAKAFGAHPIR